MTKVIIKSLVLGFIIGTISIDEMQEEAERKLQAV